MAEYIEKAKLYNTIAERENDYRSSLLKENNYNTASALQLQGLLNATTLLKYLVADYPAADVKPVVRGEWVLDTLYPSGVKKFKCSICGHERTVHEKYEGIFRQNFCANCGADMRGHTDEEN